MGVWACVVLCREVDWNDWWSLEGESLSREHAGTGIGRELWTDRRGQKPSRSSMRPHRGARRETPPAATEPQPSRERAGWRDRRRRLPNSRQRQHSQGEDNAETAAHPHRCHIHQAVALHVRLACTFILLIEGVHGRQLLPIQGSSRRVHVRPSRPDRVESRTAQGY